MRVGRYGSFGDSQYEIHRIWLVSLGKVPYRDFEWIYGSGLLYVPAWLSRWLHLSIPDSYFLFWTIASLAGVALLFGVINLVDFPSTHKTAIFVLYCVPAVVCYRLHGIEFHPAARLFSALLPLAGLQRQAAQFRAARKHASVAALTVLSTATIILISPEMAIAFAFSCAMVFCPANLVRLEGMKLVPYLFTLLALAFGSLLRLSSFMRLTACAWQGAERSAFPSPLLPPR